MVSCSAPDYRPVLIQSSLYLSQGLCVRLNDTRLATLVIGSINARALHQERDAGRFVNCRPRQFSGRRIEQDLPLTRRQDANLASAAERIRYFKKCAIA